MRLKVRHSRRGELTQSIRASEKDTAFLRCSDALREHSFSRIRHDTNLFAEGAPARPVASTNEDAENSKVPRVPVISRLRSPRQGLPPRQCRCSGCGFC